MKKTMLVVAVLLTLVIGGMAQHVPTPAQVTPGKAVVSEDVPVVIEWMTSDQRYSRHMPSLNGTWIEIRVRNTSNKSVSRLRAKAGIYDRLHDRFVDVVNLDFEKHSIFPRHLEPGKSLDYEAQLGDYQMPQGWQYGTKWEGKVVEVLTVTFKDGSVWKKAE